MFISFRNKSGISHVKLCKQPCHLAYLSLMLIITSNDIDLNPGPETTIFPCGTCDEPVTWAEKGIMCDTCNQWYHVSCQSMSSRTYNILAEDSAIAWDCLICDCPNYSSVCFDLVLSTSNSFSILSDTSLKSPLPSDCIKPIHASTPERKNQSYRPKPKNIPIKMLTVNFQSIKSKQGQVKNLVESTQPDIVLGTETWIDPTITDIQIFPPNYHIYRNDRNLKGGRVLIAIKNDHLITLVPELQTNCEIEMKDTHQKIKELAANGSSAEELWVIFKTNLNQSVTNHIPHKTAKQKDSLPWLPPSVRKLIKRRDRLYKKHKKSADPSITSKLKETKRMVQRELHRSYWNYSENIVTPKEENNQYSSMKRLLYFSFFACVHHVLSWQLTCPDSSQWKLRARGFCNITKPYYYCLYDANSLHFKDFCRSKEDFHKPGNKYIIRGDIDGEPCERNRYQPFKFKTDGYNECIFEKSVCNEEGQIVQNSGNTTADTSCRCDYTKGYGFVIGPTHKCFCNPTQEDCSCYKKKCNKNEFLNPNTCTESLKYTYVKTQENVSKPVCTSIE
ncbi:unnamed protein product [Mytilus coruscus]|uniref:PHD-type domain-containing protein n=1 Tax=Mytilus coruscus TaxID=42192 RepID=A0A6J8ER39_MYTCO|nr:unnamed protein product [Mytilus coruscus]